MNLKKALLWVAMMLAFLVGIAFFMPKMSAEKSEATKANIQIGGVLLNVIVADTPELREKGLSGSQSLFPGTGMLFVFPEVGDYRIWMKDMNFNIDIIWINNHMKVVGIEKNASKDSYPQVFIPPAPVLYVLEVPAGFSDKNRIKIGDSLSVNF